MIPVPAAARSEGAIVRSARLLVIALLIPLTAAVTSPALAAVPEPNAVIYGAGVVPLPAGTLIEARVGAEQVASYTIGTIPEAGDTYVLQVPYETPTETAEPRTPGITRSGDVVELYVNSVATGSMLVLDDRGVVAQINVDAGGDIFAPSPPTTLTSSSHSPDEWSSADTVDVSWSGAVDGQSDLAGYSVLNDNAATTEPDLTVDVVQTADPHQFSIGPLADADDHWFHLRACDVAGNCSATVRFGPIKIDRTPPTAPTDIVRIGPTDGETIELSWVAPVDEASGVDGYGWEFTEQPTGVCAATVLGSDTTAISDALGDGDWYAHVCAVDAAGNWGPVATAGPFAVQSAPPRVTAVETVGPTRDGVLDAGDRLGVPVTQLALRFSEAMNDPAGDNSPDDVSNPANYLLVAAGDDGTVETADCTTGTNPLDVPLPLLSALYEDGSSTVFLEPDAQRGLGAGRYRLLACGSIGLQDVSGTGLDGDGDGSEGDDFAIDFEVLWPNLLDNPNFDDGIDSWQFTGPASAGLFSSTEDLGAVSTSGSAEVTGVASGAQLWVVDQCLQVPADTTYQLAGSVRIDSAGPDPSVRLVLERYRDAACSVLLERTEGATVSGDSAGTFGAMRSLLATVPPAVAPEGWWMRPRLEVSTAASAGFTVFFDTVSLHDPLVISFDGFESGDTSAWSTTVGQP